MYRWLTIFTLISCSCVTSSNAESPCSGFHGATSDVRGLIGEGISLTCSVPTNCTRGYWKYDDTINATWLVPEHYSGDTYFFSFNPSQGLNTLHIYNINKRVEGFYTCLCDDYNGWRTARTCFNLSVHEVHCHICVQINGEQRILDSCSTRSRTGAVDVEVNDNITIKCDDEAERRTNCLHPRTQISFRVKPSHHRCRFSCRPKGNSAKSEIGWIILNVKNQPNSTAEVTSMTVTSTTPARKWSSHTTTNVILPHSSSKPLMTNEPPKTSTLIQDITSLSSKSDSGSTRRDVSIFGTDTSVTTTSPPPLSSGPSLSYTMKPAGAIGRHATTLTSKYHSVSKRAASENCTHLPEGATINDSGHTSMTNSFSRIFVASFVIVVLSSIVLLLFVRRTFYKMGTRSCNDKEEWVNPLYESLDNGAQLPIVIPDGGNPYNTVNGPRQVTNFSSAGNTTNNVHQINGDLGSTNEIPVEKEEASQNVAAKLLGYTVSASNVGSMKLNKPSCKQIENSPTETKTLSLPIPDEIGPPPASPHLYEMLNELVRS